MLLVLHDLLLNLGHFALILSILLLQIVYHVIQIFDFLLHVADFFLSLTRLLLQVHLELVILLFILLERLLALVKLVFLHDDVLAQQLRLLSLLVNLYLSKENLA